MEVLSLIIRGFINKFRNTQYENLVHFELHCARYKFDFPRPHQLLPGEEKIVMGLVPLAEGLTV